MAKPEAQAMDQLRRRVYFQPGNVLLLVEHPDTNEFAREDIINFIRKQMIIAEDRRVSEAVIDPARMITFPHGASARERNADDFRRATRDAFSLVFMDVSSQVKSTPGLIQLIDDLNRQIPEPQRQDVNAPVTLKIASPNWISTPATENAGGSGPGARPVPENPLDAQYHGSAVAAQGTPFSFTLNNPPASTWEEGEQVVDVAILDTAPPADILEKAYNQWQQEHPVLRSMLGPNGVFGVDRRLTIAYANELAIPLPLPEELRVAYHDYLMYDHGLFAAGIIHTLAPQANLRLVQVLNDYGVGYIEGIVGALRTLAEEPRNHPLIVNCSFTVVMPLPGHLWETSHGAADDLGDWALFQKIKRSQWKDLTRQDRGALRRMVEALGLELEWICIALRDQGVLVVAAAGNDAIDGNNALGAGRPQARFPAAFDSVTGVGALDRYDQPTSYSNKADRPEVNGLATLGGVAKQRVAVPGEAMPGEAVPGEAVLGVYIGDFPTEQPARTIANESGWAWWAGTSFATPIISGVLAQLIGNGAQPGAALQAIRDAQVSATVDGEEIFSVRQG